MKFVKFIDGTGRAAIDFQMAEEHAKTMTFAELYYSIKDAARAAEAADDLERHGHISNAGYYWDEVHVYSMELRRRKMENKY